MQSKTTNTNSIPATEIINTGTRGVLHLDDGAFTVVAVRFLREDWQSCLRVLADAPGDGRHLDLGVDADLQRRDQKLLAAACLLSCQGSVCSFGLAYAMRGNASRHPEVWTAICNYCNSYMNEHIVAGRAATQ